MPVKLGKINPVYVWVKELKLNLLKKLFSVVLTTLFLVGFNLSPAQAATTVACSGGGSFTYTGTTVDSNSGTSCVGTAVIPNAITLINTYAFASATGLTAVTIGSGVTRINDYAFNNTSLSAVAIPNNVQTLGNGVFETSPLLTTVTIGTGLTAMGAYTFGDTSGALTSVTFEGNAPTVGATPFYDSAANAKAIIKFTATGFGANGSDWNGLTVSMDRGEISCGTSGTFTVLSYDVTGNTSCVGAVNIPSGVLAIATNAFLNNTVITSVTVPDSVITIYSAAFRGTSGLISATISNSVEDIYNLAFYQSPLTSLTIGNSVTNIGDNAFSENNLTSLVIPNSVTTIGGNAFQPSRFLTSVTIGNSVSSIGVGAFSDSALLASVTFSGNAPATVGATAFSRVAGGAQANVAYNATGFPPNGSTWNGLIVSYGSNPAGDSGGSGSSPSTAVTTTTPTVIKSADAVFNLKKKKYLSKYAMKRKLSKNKSFKRTPKDHYKYSIFKASKKTCVIKGNYVIARKKTGTCDFYATRTTNKGVKYKYWVRINYTK